MLTASSVIFACWISFPSFIEVVCVSVNRYRHWRMVLSLWEKDVWSSTKDVENTRENILLYLLRFSNDMYLLDCLHQDIVKHSQQWNQHPSCYPYFFVKESISNTINIDVQFAKSKSQKTRFSQSLWVAKARPFSIAIEL